MSSVTSSAPLSLIWRGTWQASGVNSNGYQRYDCVSHAVTSPTARTDIYFAVTEIASGGAEPNPTSGQTTWKLLLEGGTIAASDGSVVYHDADGNNVLVQAAADRILEVVDGIPQFVQRDPAPVATFEGYKLPTTPAPGGYVPVASSFWISGDRVFGSGAMWEGFCSTATDYESSSLRLTVTPFLFAPRDDDAQVPIGKIFHGHRCVFAIGKDDKSKVYGLGLNDSRFGDGVDDTTTVVYDAFQKIQFFEDNGINIENIVTSDDTTTNAVRRSVDTDDTAHRQTKAFVYFIQEVVDVGGVDTGGNVYISAGSGLTFTGLAGGITRDATVRQLTGFDQPIIGATCYINGALFWSKRKVYALGTTVITAGGAAQTVSTVTELGSFDSDIVYFHGDKLSDQSATLVLADGRAYYYSYKAPTNTRTTTLFEQMPVISGKLYAKVACINVGTTIAAVMDDNSLYIEGRYYDSSTARTVTGLTEVELPFDMEVRDIFFDAFLNLNIITTDGNLIGNLQSGNTSMIVTNTYKMNVVFDGNNITLSTDPGWVGRAESVIEIEPISLGAKFLQTEDGYIYTSNTISNAVDENDTSIGLIAQNARRPSNVNFQHQVDYTGTTATGVLASSYRVNAGTAGTGIISPNTTTSFSIQVNGSMIQRPTLRSYQIT